MDGRKRRAPPGAAQVPADPGSLQRFHAAWSLRVQAWLEGERKHLRFDPARCVLVPSDSEKDRGMVPSLSVPFAGWSGPVPDVEVLK